MQGGQASKSKQSILDCPFLLALKDLKKSGVLHKGNVRVRIKDKGEGKGERRLGSGSG